MRHILVSIKYLFVRYQNIILVFGFPMKNINPSDESCSNITKRPLFLNIIEIDVYSSQFFQNIYYLWKPNFHTFQIMNLLKVIFKL